MKIATLLLAAVASSIFAADWPAWRGPTAMVMPSRDKTAGEMERKRKPRLEGRVALFLSMGMWAA